MNEKEFKTGLKSEDEKPAKSAKAKGAIIALKDHILFAPPLIPDAIEIKEGDDLTKLIAKIPKAFHDCLLTEGVLKG